uniref:Putative adenosylhomocysteinase 2 (Trinotate prediction) n=1 Tax=Henneguya salminicola TaxID=69463 RepID=A0A6G3MGU5_HENSL
MQAKDGLPGLLIIKEINKNTVPLKGAYICGCSNINPHIAVLVQTLIEFGATVGWCTSNINAVENDVCSAMTEFGVNMFAWCGESEEDYWWCIEECIISAGKNPNFIIDDGGDMTTVMLNKFPKLFHNLKGIIEISPYGVYKLYSLANDKQLLVPAINITNAVSLDQFNRIFYFRECLLKW